MNKRLALNFPLDLLGYLYRIILWNVTGPASAYTRSAIDKDHRQDRSVVGWLNLESFFILIAHDWHVIFRVQQPRHLRQISKNVPTARIVFPSLLPGAKLPQRL